MMIGPEKCYVNEVKHMPIEEIYHGQDVTLFNRYIKHMKTPMGNHINYWKVKVVDNNKILSDADLNNINRNLTFGGRYVCINDWSELEKFIIRTKLDAFNTNIEFNTNDFINSDPIMTINIVRRIE